MVTRAEAVIRSRRRRRGLSKGEWDVAVRPIAARDIGGPSRKGGDRIHRRDLRHPLAVALLTRCQARLQLVHALLGRLACSLAQILVTHHHALAVGADDEQVVLGVSRGRPLLVECIEVLRGTHRELLDLPLCDRRTRVVAHDLHHLVERRPRLSLATIRRMPCENISRGRLSAASIGCRSVLPGACVFTRP
jgi:hypothetical protein